MRAGIEVIRALQGFLKFSDEMVVVHARGKSTHEDLRKTARRTLFLISNLLQTICGLIIINILFASIQWKSKLFVQILAFANGPFAPACSLFNICVMLSLKMDALNAQTHHHTKGPTSLSRHSANLSQHASVTRLNTVPSSDAPDSTVESA
eukprot:TRINITY_DN4680_c0_g1_i2.p1 TRINITY_DN4680_c0_g1~~TRINITY_DN4680_c0_g1_i2.p1  ORF type:complete len:151 (-),score=28.48 TRINITY_DN4680_c0_g1_i2:106-558(-)